MRNLLILHDFVRGAYGVHDVYKIVLCRRLVVYAYGVHQRNWPSRDFPICSLITPKCFGLYTRLIWTPQNLKMGIFHTKLINQFSPMVVRYIDLMEHSISQSLEKNFFREKWEMRKMAFIQDLNWPEEEFAKYLQVRMRTLAAEIISNSADGSNIVELWPDGISYKLASLQMPAHMRDFDKITIRRVDNEVAAFFQQLRTTFSGLGVVINTHSNKHSSWQQSDYAQQHWATAPDMRSPSYGVQANFLVEKAPNTAEKCNGIVAGPIGKLEHTAVSLSISEDSEELQAIKVLQQKVTARFDQLSNNMKRMYSNLRHRNLM
uniref:DUF1041 domain-containing protein n=1 Tax=Globodera pallida TaxID=36090 RepID=A0A183CI22_GLOPA